MLAQNYKEREKKASERERDAPTGATCVFLQATTAAKRAKRA